MLGKNGQAEEKKRIVEAESAKRLKEQRKQLGRKKKRQQQPQQRRREKQQKRRRGKERKRRKQRKQKQRKRRKQPGHNQGPRQRMSSTRIRTCIFLNPGLNSIFGGVVCLLLQNCSTSSTLKVTGRSCIWTLEEKEMTDAFWLLRHLTL